MTYLLLLLILVSASYVIYRITLKNSEVDKKSTSSHKKHNNYTFKI